MFSDSSIDDGWNYTCDLSTDLADERSGWDTESTGIHAAFLNSSLTQGQYHTALKYAMQGRYKIIYVAPERLETEGFINFALNSGVKISMLAVDEAHCVSQWGQDFRPSYLKILEFLKKLPYRPVLTAYTATATAEVRDDIMDILNLRDPFVLTTGFDRENLTMQ